MTEITSYAGILRTSRQVVSSKGYNAYAGVSPTLMLLAVKTMRLCLQMTHNSDGSIYFEGYEFAAKLGADSMRACGLLRSQVQWALPLPSIPLQDGQGL